MANKDERRAARFQIAQRRKAAAIEAEKDRQRGEEAQGLTLHYNNGGPIPAGLITLQPGGYISGWNVVGPSFAIDGRDRRKLDLPKSKDSEPIVAYRMWPLSRSYPDGYRLTAANVHFDGTISPNAKLEAECKIQMYGYWGDDGDTAKSKHVAPDPDCSCGIHAYKTSVPLSRESVPYAAGEVFLWGRVIEHETGYRAQYAYPKKLVVIDGGERANHIAVALELTYGVPCEVFDA